MSILYNQPNLNIIPYNLKVSFFSFPLVSVRSPLSPVRSPFSPVSLARSYAIHSKCDKSIDYIKSRGIIGYAAYILANSDKYKTFHLVSSVKNSKFLINVEDRSNYGFLDIDHFEIFAFEDKVLIDRFKDLIYGLKPCKHYYLHVIGDENVDYLVTTFELTLKGPFPQFDDDTSLMVYISFMKAFSLSINDVFGNSDNSETVSDYACFATGINYTVLVTDSYDQNNHNGLIPKNSSLFTTTKSLLNYKSKFDIVNNEFSFEKKDAKAAHVSMNINQFRDFNLFQALINKTISYNNRYILYTKIRYNENTYRMVGNQIGFIYKDVDSLLDIYTIINNKLNVMYDAYTIDDQDIVYINFKFRALDPVFTSEFNLDLAIVNKLATDTKTIKDSASIPISINENYLGEALPVSIENGMIKDIIIVINDIRYNFLDRIREKARYLGPKHKDNITSFDCSYKFYITKYDMNKYFTVIAIKELSDNNVVKISYHSNGNLIQQVIDVIDDNGILYRRSNNNELVIKDKNVIGNNQYHDLKQLNMYIKKSRYLFANPNIGVIDTETYLSDDKTHKIYAAGFLTSNSPFTPIIKYIERVKETLELLPNKLVLDLIDELLRPRYKDIQFYCHNLAIL